MDLYNRDCMRCYADLTVIEWRLDGDLVRFIYSIVLFSVFYEDLMGIFWTRIGYTSYILW